MSQSQKLDVRKQGKYLIKSLMVLPSSASYLDTSRMTIAFFGISGLDILQQLESKSPKERDEMCKWIENLYVYDKFQNVAGFHGSSYLRTCVHGFLNMQGHVAMTYTALASLKILDYDLSSLNLKAIANGLTLLQQMDGSFNSCSEGGENDMRFVYCACAVSHMIGDWSGVDIPRATQFVLDSITYEGSIAVAPNCEGHGGSTFCGVAALKLMGTLDRLSQKQKKKLVWWCINRLSDGFNGRPNKPDDTCYSFWIGASLKILDPFPNVEQFIGKSQHFILDTQDELIGGLAKSNDNVPDPLHTYLGLSALSLSGYPGLLDIDPTININKKIAQMS